MINVTIAGELGSGKSTVAHFLVKKINYRIESAGLIFRRLAEQHNMSAKEFNEFIENDPKYDNYVDDTIKEMGEKEENIIFDSRMAWYFVPKSFKVYMYVDVDIATERIFNDKGRIGESYVDKMTARQEIIDRRKSEVLRYSNFYHTDINNYKNYDFIIDTGHAPKDEINELVLNSFLAYKEGKQYTKIWFSPKTLNLTKNNDNQSDVNSKDIEIVKHDNTFYVYRGHEKVKKAITERVNILPVQMLYENNDILPDGKKVEDFINGN